MVSPPDIQTPNEKLMRGGVKLVALFIGATNFGKWTLQQLALQKTTFTKIRPILQLVVAI
jgi:hypothetical protein